ncbi:MAG: hypothetical protein GF346_00305 [Candidatus Eisenbacteria bacterium]|nr:hypothetical protein [Candidatus Latescibacterota bacterium]MBD3300874.1 hypothetical protein [Candidatus Eisenbacteria bacterium]
MSPGLRQQGRRHRRRSERSRLRGTIGGRRIRSRRRPRGTGLLQRGRFRRRHPARRSLDDLERSRPCDEGLGSHTRAGCGSGQGDGAARRGTEGPDPGPRHASVEREATMKVNWFAVVVLALLSAGALAQDADAVEVTTEEARTVAENYIAYTIARYGSWGTHESAEVSGIEPFLQGDRMLGYYCPVEPEGYFILGLYRDLAPIRFYSVHGRLDPTSEEGMADLLRVRTVQLYDAIEERLGHPIGRDEDFRAVLPVAYGDAWEVLGDPGYEPIVSREAAKTRSAGMNYQPGDYLVKTVWTQRPPYNDQCPDGGCDWPGYGHYNTNFRVGCVGTAGSQIMKYFNWPPFGFGGGYDDPYDWANMGDAYWWDDGIGNFWYVEDGVWTEATQAQIDAVAELNFEYSWACETDYGCSESSVTGTDPIIGAFTWFYYYSNDIDAEWKADNSFSQYWGKLKDEFDHNRPVLYLIPGHAIIADGWKEEWIDDPTYGLHYEWMHINYGWGGSYDGWCPPAEVPEGDFSEEGFIRRISPNTSIGDLIGDYELPSGGPYRYFDLDSTGYDANVAAGHRLQVLGSGFLLTHLYGAGPIYFNGEPGSDTLFFIDGDTVGESRIRIKDGQIKMTGGGQLAIY